MGVLRICVLKVRVIHVLGIFLFYTIFPSKNRVYKTRDTSKF